MGLSQRSELGTGLNRPPFGIRIDRSAEDLVVFFFCFSRFLRSSGKWVCRGFVIRSFPRSRLDSILAVTA